MTRIAGLALVVATAIAGCGATNGSDARAVPGPLVEPTPAPTPTSTAIGPRARLGDGFVIWESRRGGRWRLWIQRLSGADLRRLTADEPGRAHCCGQIAPGGDQIAYASVPSGAEKSVDDAVASLHVVRPDGSGDRVVVAAARVLGGNRAVVWRSDTELIHLDGDGRTILLDLASGASRRLTEATDSRLINATLTHATGATPTFSPYDNGRAVVAPQRPRGGCEPYFSHDGRFGFWVAGAGGPIDRIDLATGQTSTIIEKNDPRLPDDRGYLYFPMLSRAGTAFAFAASAGEHDHLKADYDIYVAEADPRALELVGAPVRMTNDPATDRYPDVFMAPLALGRHFGEAPFTLRVAGTAVATYEVPGTYTYAHDVGAGRESARVTVLPAAAPQLVGVEVSGERELRVTFDEPVELAALAVSLAAGSEITGTTPLVSGRGFTVTLEAPLRAADRLHIKGVVDRAQVPNRMAALSAEIAAPRWPSNPTGLAFLWERADRPNLVHDHALGGPRTDAATPIGRAVLDHDFSMSLAGGHFEAPGAAGANVCAALKATNSLTIEAVLHPASLAQTGYPLVFGRDRQELNFIVGQIDAAIVLWLRTGRWSPAAPVVLAPLPRADRPIHLIVSYRPGRLEAYVDGVEVLVTDTLQGDFFHWRPRPLWIGAEPHGQRPGWHGTVSSIAVYDRAVGAAEARENARRLGVYGAP